MIYLSASDLMLASNGPIRNRPGWLYEFKLDGYRTVVSKDRRQVRMMSRNGKDATPWYPNLVEAIAALDGTFVIDCEICVLDDRGVPDFASKRRTGFTLYAFDLLYAGGRDLRTRPLLERKKKLEKLIRGRSPPLNYVSHILDEGIATFEFAIRIGMEGIVAKRSDSLYKAGRGIDWIKTKPPGVHDGWKRPLRQRTETYPR